MWYIVALVACLTLLVLFGNALARRLHYKNLVRARDRALAVLEAEYQHEQDLTLRTRLRPLDYVRTNAELAAFQQEDTLAALNYEKRRRAILTDFARRTLPH